MITSQISQLEQQPSLNSQPNQTGLNPTASVIRSLGPVSPAINSPAKLPLVGGVAGNQIAGDAPFNSFGSTSTVSSVPATGVPGSVRPITNSTHDMTASTIPDPAASTWSKFAQQSGPSQAIETTKTLDSFQQFKKQAKEKQDKEKLIEMQEQRRKEQQEREQQEREQQERERQERLTQQDQEGEMALNSLARAEQSPVLSPASDSQSPASGAGTSGGGSGMLKLREQERRKREALASQNQMDLSRQSEIMSKFEDRA